MKGRSHSRTLAVVCLLLLTLRCSPAHAAGPKPTTPRSAVADAVARYAAFSLGGSPRVAKLAVTLGDSCWFYDASGRRLFRCERVKPSFGGVCKGWAAARVAALDRWGSDLYGPVKVVVCQHRDIWIGRMLGHSFTDASLGSLGMDARTIRRLRAKGL